MRPTDGLVYPRPEDDVAALELGALSDVDLSTPPSDGDILVFDSGSGKWLPVAPSAGAGGSEGIDALPAAPDSEDEEFETTDGFSWDNQGSAVAHYRHHSLILETPASATSSVRTRYKAIGSPSSDWRYRTKLSLSIKDFTSAYGGLVLWESATNKRVIVTLGRESGIVYAAALRFTSATSGLTAVVGGGGGVLTLGTQYALCLQPWILEAERVGANIFYRLLPPEGGEPIELATEALTGSFTTEPDRWGVMADVINGSNKCFAAFKWARRG